MVKVPVTRAVYYYFIRARHLIYCGLLGAPLGCRPRRRASKQGRASGRPACTWVSQAIFCVSQRQPFDGAPAAVCAPHTHDHHVTNPSTEHHTNVCAAFALFCSIDTLPLAMLPE